MRDNTVTRSRARVLPGFIWQHTPGSAEDPRAENILGTANKGELTAFSFTLTSTDPADAAIRLAVDWVGVTIGGPIPPLPPVIVTARETASDEPVPDPPLFQMPGFDQNFHVEAYDITNTRLLLDDELAEYLLARKTAGQPTDFVFSSNWVFCRTDQFTTREEAVTFASEVLTALRLDLATTGAPTGWAPDDLPVYVIDKFFPSQTPTAENTALTTLPPVGGLTPPRGAGLKTAIRFVAAIAVFVAMVEVAKRLLG